MSDNNALFQSLEELILQKSATHKITISFLEVGRKFVVKADDGRNAITATGDDLEEALGNWIKEMIKPRKKS